MAETGMDRADMKAMLNRAKSDPVNCAVAQGDGASPAMLLMHKTKQSRALEKQLKDDFPNSKNWRFGTVSVNLDDNPKLARFTLNKVVTAMAPRLVKTLKGTGFNKVLIVLDDGTEVESHEEADEDEAVAPAAAGPLRPPPGGAPKPVDPAAKAAELERLRKLLAALAPRIPAAAGTDDRRKAELMKFATDANVNMRTGNLTYAAVALSQLQTALDTSVVKAGAVVFAKSRLAWVGTREKVTADIGKLGAELAKSYAGTPVAAEITQAFDSKTQQLMALFDSRLVNAIDAVMANDADDKRDALVTVARDTAKDFLATVNAEPLIDALDDNPFVPLTVRATLTATLSSLSKALQ